MASLPALLASNIKSASPRYKTNNHPATASNSSQSETSSPLQSPSPFAQAVDGLDNSPKEESFILPPPAYPNPLYHQTYQPASVPVKIPSHYKAPSSAHDHSYTGRHSVKESTTPVQPGEATLRYGRRPGQTNSVTSPMALFPVDKRRPSHGANGASRPSNLVPSPALPPRNVSEPTSATAQGRSTLAEQRKHFAYGGHSPLLMANNSPRRPSYGIDFVNANAQSRDRSPSNVESSSVLKNAQQGKRTSIAGSSTRSPVKQFDLASSLIERRKSFPVQLFAKPKALKPVATDKIGATPLASSDEDEPTPVRLVREEETLGRGRSREKRRPAVDREDSREASRSRSSGLRLDFSRERFDRSGSSRRRSHRDVDRDRRSSRRRERSRSSERSRHSGDERIQSQITPINGTTRGGQNGRELATIIGSLQLQDRHPGSGAVDAFATYNEEQEDDYQPVRSISPLATMRLGRTIARGREGSVSPRDRTQVPRKSPVEEERGRGRSKERTSRAAEKLQKLFDEGMTS